MFKKFQKHLLENFPEIENQKILLALSGGIDSSVMLNLCIRSGLLVSIAHCNFQLRGRESIEDELWIKNISKNKNLKCYIKRFETRKVAKEEKLSIQVAARNLRYNWFNELSRNYNFDLVLLAHHANDSLETFMINTMRGSGLRGLLGIPKLKGKIFRPLLPFSKVQIMKYAKNNHIKWREDSTNEKTDYLRNALRHEVIPVWKEINPYLEERFLTTLTHLGEIQKALDYIILDLKDRYFLKEKEYIKISINQLDSLKPHDYFLFSLFNQYGFRHVSDLKKLLKSQSGKELISDTHRLIRDRSFLLLTEKTNIINKTFSISSEVRKIKDPISLKLKFKVDLEIENKNVVCFDKSMIKFPLILRKWREGDFFYPKGFNGKKKLSKYFKDEKFSLLEKEKQWLLCSGDNIIWVVGKRADNRYLANNNSKNKFQIMYNG